jgi:NADPH:quinone reductase-like Zn-dependent oxidoreductase
MHCYAITHQFGIENLVLEERASPKPKSNDIKVRMLAASLNYRDMQVLSGLRNVSLPLIPLSDACAEVIEVGENTSRFKVGDRVMPVFINGWISGRQPMDDEMPTLGGPLDGTLCEEACWHEENAVLVPAHLTDVEAASLPCAAVSAWNALFVATHTGPGDAVLIQGTGGVSLFALQFAKMAGARVAIISSHDEKLEKAKVLGADVTVNYKQYPEWGSIVRDQAGPVDTVVEVGGSRTLEQSLICLRNAGHVSIVGFLSGTEPKFDLGELSRKSVRVQGIRVGNRDSFEAMCRAVSIGGIKPVIESVGTFEDAKSTLVAFRDGNHFGKVCITF